MTDGEKTMTNSEFYWTKIFNGRGFKWKQKSPAEANESFRNDIGRIIIQYLLYSTPKLLIYFYRKRTSQQKKKIY